MTSVIAAIVNVFFPGFGQLVQGRLLAALVRWLVLVPLGILAGLTGVFLVLFVPMYVLCIFDAARYRPT